MMKPKRMLTLLTAAGLCLAHISLVPVMMPAATLTASAANSGICGENVTWTLNNGVLTISGTGAMKDQDLPCDFSKLTFSKAVIQDGVTSIGQMSFERCFGLKSVTIASSVTSIGFQAFYQCTALTDITIPESVTEFGADVFNETPWLEAKQKENPLVVVNDILIDGSTCSGDITIPEGIKCIGTYAFDLCKELTSVRIPDSVTRICGGAFASCWELKSVNIPKSVTYIEDAAFSRCSSLTDIKIPDSVTKIGSAVFRSCYALTSIQIPNSVTSIGLWAFDDCSNLTSITIPNSVTSIDEFAFTGCKKLSIKGYDDSPAETYANEQNIPFVSLGEPPAPLRGDMTGDGEVSVDDAQLTLKAYTERIAGNDMKLTDDQFKAADVDGNGEISVEDAQWLLKYYTEKYVAGKDITWDDIFGKKTQALPRLIRKRIPSLKLR